MLYSAIVTDLENAGCKWSASFGYPGEGGYNEFWRDPTGRRFVISNGTHWDCAPFDWSVAELIAA